MKKEIFFNLNPKKSDLDNVISFVGTIPRQIELLIGKRESNFTEYIYLNNKNLYKLLGNDIIYDSFNESTEYFNSNFIWFRRRIKSANLLG